MKYQAIRNIGLAAVIAGSTILTSGCRTSDIYSDHSEMYNTVISDIEHKPRNERELKHKRRLAKHLVAAIYENDDTRDIPWRGLSHEQKDNYAMEVFSNKNILDRARLLVSSKSDFEQASAQKGQEKNQLEEAIAQIKVGEVRDKKYQSVESQDTKVEAQIIRNFIRNNYHGNKPR